MSSIVNFAHLILQKSPAIRTNLRIAHNKQTPEDFVKKTIRISLFASAGVTAISFFLLSANNVPVMLMPFIMAGVFVVGFFPLLVFFLNAPKSEIRKREKEINNEVLFAGRYILVKLQSGYPLINTLDDASRSTGSTSKYFREIMNDVNTGTPLEEALQRAVTYNASDKFRRILWEITTTIKIGTELTSVLNNTLKSIAVEQNLEIKKYGKKLNSIIMFYMIVGCVAPSLGLTMFIIISGFLSLDIEGVFLYALLFMLSVIQLMFVIILRASRPTVTI